MMADRKLGPYQLIELIATGGMGQLYLATRTGLGGFTKIAAVKCILPDLAGTSEFRRMFLDEARVAASLDHPNIVSTFELGEAEGAYFIAMEYLPGEDLAAVVHRTKALGRRIPVEIAVAIASGCADALHYAHELPGKDGLPSQLVHRDVNPSNIVITYHGAVKLLDFGIAKMRDSSIRTRGGSFRGKLRYSAPEQVEGAAVDRRTDMFSLGVVLWECLTGTPLFDGAEAQIVEAIRSKPIRPPSSVRSEVPRELDEIVMRALDRAPERRHQSAREFAAELGALAFTGGSHQQIARWLESLFGAPRAAWKIGVARGQRAPEPAPLEPVATTSSGFKMVWSSDLPSREPSARTTETAIEAGVHPFLSELPQEGTSRKGWWIVLPIVAVVGGGSAVAFLRSPVEPAPAHTSYSVDVATTPPGARIYVAGSPTGRKTPATIEALGDDAAIRVRVVLDGYRSDEKPCAPGNPCLFNLEKATGIVDLVDLPAGARIYVDGVESASSSRLELNLGSRMLRIENGDVVIFEGPVEVVEEGTRLSLGAD